MKADHSSIDFPVCEGSQRPKTAMSLQWKLARGRRCFFCIQRIADLRYTEMPRVNRAYTARYSAALSNWRALTSGRRRGRDTYHQRAWEKRMLWG
ncbi:hypothetical protein [Ralstonia insidiosa]|uniref:Uncharacterized protein n=1 Tax=Ralstonia insidiosa TaxID=190721 RepID=A0A848NYH1_9RALS|nr:hypothetical protein [Ralstonia insidiosa]NMV40112.1 hypothetical protein [Ralstonia insidiosa]